MDLHYGQIIEKVIRREGYSISEVAKFTRVNRRSVYYWFNQKYLKTEIIYRIGVGLKHDFSVEFPHLFTSDDFKKVNNDFNSLGFNHESAQPAPDMQNSSFWKDKYVDLLEKYNDLLIRNAERFYALETEHSL